ncbi:hypothetical protein [Brevibacillus brevis]|uniref:Pentapeptide repeat-containing protein n=1 Tax=Brevibacillus brevis TaxID=1393 RepID=A0A517I1J9_BREBE|nr:hypothetical protein [Brevibacillus brevis]QDS32775.1 hypothetical protein FPS98_01600 [Brevibacillus brevis]
MNLKVEPLDLQMADVSGSKWQEVRAEELGQFRNCDLSNVEITDCDITGLKINGILISDLIKGK